MLLLNPDARIERGDLDALVAVLDADPAVGLAGPRILEEDGALAFSQRRFPRLRSTFAQALFLHRIWPRARWTDELIRDPGAYERPGSPDWVSGACMLSGARRSRRSAASTRTSSSTARTSTSAPAMRDAGWSIRFEPAASVRHEGGASAPREQPPVLRPQPRALRAQALTRRAAVALEARRRRARPRNARNRVADAPGACAAATCAPSPPSSRPAGPGWPSHVRNHRSLPHRRRQGAAAARATCCAAMTEQIELPRPRRRRLRLGDGCSLGARRLSIIDVEGGHQPFANEDGRVWAAQNGEIYNHEALRGELSARGHVLRSRCDTEVLPHLYEEHGPGSRRAPARHVRGRRLGPRAAAACSSATGSASSPCTTPIVGDVVVFGSELKCVIASGLVSDELDPEAIAAYLTLGYVPAR